MSDTPETDAVLARLVDNQSGNSCDAVVIHHARKLERERDEARKEIKELKFELALTGIPTTVEEVEREEWRQERDALRAEVERLKSERENWRVSSVCRKLRAEVNQLKADKARLDWLEKRESMEGFTRDAIDAAMKGEL